MKCLCKKSCGTGSCPCSKLLKTPTSLITAAGLIGGWQVARRSGVRPLGGVVLALAGAAAAHRWYHEENATTCGVLTGAYLAAFGVTHPLAKKFGAWPTVLTVTASNSALDHVMFDSGH